MVEIGPWQECKEIAALIFVESLANIDLKLVDRIDFDLVDMTAASFDYLVDILEFQNSSVYCFTAIYQKMAVFVQKFLHDYNCFHKVDINEQTVKLAAAGKDWAFFLEEMRGLSLIGTCFQTVFDNLYFED